MLSLTLLSWNINNLGRTQFLPSLIATLAVRQQADVIILVDPHPAAETGKGLSGALRRAILPANTIVQDICSALNTLEELPARDETRPFQWRHLECDPSFQPTDLPKVLTTTVTIDQRGEISLETGFRPSGQRRERSAGKTIVKAAHWDAEVTRLRSLLGKQQWRPFIPAPEAAITRRISIPRQQRTPRKAEADFAVFYDKKCKTRQVKDHNGTILYQQVTFSYLLKNKDFNASDSSITEPLESIRKVLTDLGVISANADTYHVLFRGMPGTGEGPHQQFQVVSITLPDDSADLAGRSYQPLPVMVGSRIHLRWLGLNGDIPGASPASAPANGRAPGLLNTWWKGHYLPLFLSHLPLSSPGQRQVRAGFEELSTLSIVPSDGSPVSLSQARDALLWLDTGLPSAALAGAGPGKMVKAFAQKGKFKALLAAANAHADDQKTALIDVATYLADPEAFDHANQFRSDAFDLLFFKAQTGIIPVPSRVLDLVELFFWGCLYRLQERMDAGKLGAGALPNLTTFIEAHAAEVRRKGVLLPVDLFCLLGKTPAADMTTQALLGDAFLACHTLTGAHLPVLTSFKIN